MKRLEIIHLRLSRPHPPGLSQEIRKSMAGQKGLISIHIYRHATIKTDFAVHLHLEAGAKDPQLTELGIRLASALRQYGMVEHTVWFEEQTVTTGEER